MKAANKATTDAAEPQVLKISAKGVTVKIYPRAKPNGKGFNYQVADYSTGKRKFISCPSEADAVTEAKRIANLIATGDAKAIAMTGEDRQKFATIQNICEPLKIDPVAAVSEYAAAFQKLGGRSLLEAVNDYVKRNPTARESRPLVTAIEELVAARKADKRSTAYVRDLETRLGVFADTYKNYNVGDITSNEVNSFLRSLDCGGRSRNNYRAALSTLFRFCSGEKQYVSKDHIVFSKTEIPQATENAFKIEIFTPDEVKKLLKAAKYAAPKPGVNLRYVDDQGLLPLIVLGAFAGIRTGAEIKRQLWSDIHIFDAPQEVKDESGNKELIYGQIVITAEKGNTAQNRIIPIQKNLAEWLKACKRTAATCCAYARPEDAIARLAKRAGVEWKHNGLRHSYISYRVAQTQDVPKVALEAGNSERMIFKHYRKPLPPTAAPEWFAITPDAIKDDAKA